MMHNIAIAVTICCVAFLIFVIGWVTSASTIGRECKLLGSFYISNTVYECKVKS
jgi:hypothetical protein